MYAMLQDIVHRNNEINLFGNFTSCQKVSDCISVGSSLIRHGRFKGSACWIGLSFREELSVAKILTVDGKVPRGT